MNTRTLVLFALMSSAWFCGAVPKQNHELAHLPAPVRKAIHGKLGDAKLVSIAKDNEDGDLTYEVGMIKDGKERSFTVDSTGALVDEQVFVEELPAAVQKAIVRQAMGQSIEEIDKSVDDDLVSYEVEEMRAGVERSFVVDGDGILLETQLFLNELPAPVRQTMQKQAAGGVLGDINRLGDGSSASYSVELTRAGKTHEFSVDARGQMEEMEVELADLPEAVQAAIKKSAGNSSPDEIEKTFDGDETNYDVDMDGKTYSFDSTGELFYTEEDINLTDAPAPVQEQIKTLLADGKLSGLSKVTEDGEVSYDADMIVAGSDKSATLDLNGKVLPDE